MEVTDFKAQKAVASTANSIVTWKGSTPFLLYSYLAPLSDKVVAISSIFNDPKSKGELRTHLLIASK